MLNSVKSFEKFFTGHMFLRKFSNFNGEKVRNA